MTRSDGCDVAAQLGAHLDAQSRVTSEVVARVRAHVAVCASCRTQFGLDLAIADQLARVPPVVPPPWRAPRLPWRRLVPWTAAAVLLILARWPDGLTRVRMLSAPVAAVFQQVERRFRLGGDAGSQYVITTTYHSVITSPAIARPREVHPGNAHPANAHHR